MNNMQLLLTGVLFTTFIMVISKRVRALIQGFRAQSFFLFLAALYIAIVNNNVEVYIVAALLFFIKVIAIPYMLLRMARRLKVEDGSGLFVNPTLSIFIAVLLTYLSYLFASRVMPGVDKAQGASVVISMSVTFIGLFIMISRMKAVSQIIGLLVMENGLFLMAVSSAGGMPFFVEIAIFFDIFVCVVILGMFVYKINKLFTHINVSKMQELKG